MKRFVLLLIAVMLFGYSNVVLASFGVNQDIETFEGATFPPPGWATICGNDPGSPYGCWAQQTASTYVSTAGFSGNAAACIYGDYSLSTKLITPAFSTEGFTEVKIEFSGYFYFYDGYANKCDLQYSTNGGSTWNTLKTWDWYGNPATESINLPADALGKPSVMLQWDRYTPSYPYYYALVDNVKLTAPTAPPASIPTLSEWGMIFMSLMMAGSAIWIIRRRQAS